MRWVMIVQKVFENVANSHPFILWDDLWRLL